MSIKFNVVERGEPGVTGGGTKKFYALAQSSGVADIDSLTKSIEKISTVSGADIRAVLYALVDVITDELSEGRITRLGDLGSVRVSLSSKGMNSQDEVNSAAISHSRILFTPGPKLKTMLATLKYQKSNS